MQTQPLFADRSPDAASLAATAAPTEGATTSLRILTCGSVDDGKSTLIGRLLWDATDLYDDQREALLGGAAGRNAHPDFSRLCDGLIAEREQGITIDVAWRYFDTSTRRIVLIDSPGHEQYTRNMASGASHADLAILLVDARHGIKRQTRRHAAILDLMGVRNVVLAVNKVDLTGYDEHRFREIAAAFEILSGRFSFASRVAIPLAALTGENVAARAASMPWYGGPTLLEHIAEVSTRLGARELPFRMAVQRVLRDGADFRGLAGTVSAGAIAIGSEIVDVLSGRRARVARIATMDAELERAQCGHAVVVGLDRDLDIARGDVIADPSNAPVAADVIAGRIVWLSEQPFDPRADYLLRTATDTASVATFEITGLLDLATLEVNQAAACEVNDIALVALRLGRRVALDVFGELPETGSFLVVDAVSGATVAAGTVTSARQIEGRPSMAPGAGERVAHRRFALDDATLRHGLCSDLGSSAEDQVEFRRRAREVAAILAAAGVRLAEDTGTP